MIRIPHVIVVAIVVCISLNYCDGFPWDSSQKIAWDNNLERAKMASAQSGKPILLHFYSDTCPPCRMMEQNTFPNAAVVDQVEKNFIPVKLNIREYPNEAQYYRIQAVPSDLILNSSGQVIKASRGGQKPDQYNQFLASAIVYNPPAVQQQPVVQQSSGVQQPSGGSASDPNLPPPLPDFPALPSQTTSEPAVPVIPQVGTQGACPIDETPSFDYNKIPDEDKTRIEYEGYCPVELSKHQLWVRGDYRIRELFEGRLYLFAGEQQRQEFKQNPALFAPAYQGIDLVAYRETGNKIQGTRAFGAWAVGRVFLFSSEDNLEKFEKNARLYLKP